MPYKCTVCGKFYHEGSVELKEVMKSGGCVCGKKFLMYIRGTSENAIPVDVISDWDKKGYLAKPEVINVPKTEKKEADIEFLHRELLRVRDTGKPVFLGIETIRILEEGKYELDVAALMKGKPVIVKTKEGVYYIDVPYAMRKTKKAGD